MKLNKKGMSLMELLVTIVLIGIVLTFIFQLLVDLKNERETNNFANNNQLNRIEIIQTIGNDLNNYTLQSITNASADGNLAINFNYRGADGTKTATLSTSSSPTTDDFGDPDTDHYISYNSFNNEKHTWKMNGAEIDPCASFSFYKDNLSNKYYFKLNIYVYNKPYHERNNKTQNNAVDDIEISYVGLIRNLNGPDNALTSNKIDTTIGKCTN